MTKSVTVNFDDGTSHVYDNVPDEVTDDQVSARAAGEFSDKTISGVGGNTTPASEVAPGREPTVGEQFVAGAQTFANTVKPAAEFVMQHPIESAAVASYVPGVNRLPIIRDVKEARQALYNKYVGAKGAIPTPAMTPAPTAVVPPSAEMSLAEQVAKNLTAEEMMNAAKGQGLPERMAPTTAAPTTAQGRPFSPQGQAFLSSRTPATPPAPTVGGPAAQQGSNFIERITKQFAPVAERVAPVLKSVANSPIINNPVTRFAASAPVMGAQLALTPSSTGPAVPSRGPMRGSEINPTTGRPWTAQELQRYHAQY